MLMAEVFSVFYVPCMIGCLLVLPAIAIMQLGYGVFQITRRMPMAVLD